MDRQRPTPFAWSIALLTLLANAPFLIADENGESKGLEPVQQVQAIATDGVQQLPPTIVEASRPQPEPQPSPGGGAFTPVPASFPPAPFTPSPVTGYNAESSLTALGFNAPSIDVPATISVVPRPLIQDQLDIRLDDLLRNVPGAVKDESALVRPNQFTLRGFSLQFFDFRRDGLADPTASPRDLADIDRVEFLQGPSSVLYGSGQPGGIVNFISRMPQTQPANSVQAQFGSFELSRLDVDSTGPLLTGANLYYRVDAAVQDSGSFRDFGFDQRQLVTPSVTWVLDSNTRLTFQEEIYHDRQLFDAGVPTLNGVVGVVPISRSVNEPNDVLNTTDYRTALFLDHRFAENCTFHLAGEAFWFPADGSRTTPAEFLPPGPGVAEGTLLRVKEEFSTQEEQYHSLIADVAIEEATGSLLHKLLFGSELGWLRVPDFKLQSSNPLSTPLLLNIFQPVYNNGQYGAPNPPLPFLLTIVQNQDRYAWFGEDLIDLGHRLKLLVGARYDIAHDFVDQRSNQPLGFPATDTMPLAVPVRTVQDATYYHWSSRLGLVFEPLPERLAMYGSFSQSFDTVFGTEANGQALVPETGFQWEGGRTSSTKS